MLFLYVLLIAFVFVKLLGADVIGDSAPKKDKKKKDRDAKSAQVPALQQMGGSH